VLAQHLFVLRPAQLSAQIPAPALAAADQGTGSILALARALVAVHVEMATIAWEAMALVVERSQVAPLLAGERELALASLAARTALAPVTVPAETPRGLALIREWAKKALQNHLLRAQAH
jgi:hypothetical protein